MLSGHAKGDGKVVRYATFFTGNYNAKTSRIDSDISIFTAKSGICRDIAELFSYLSGKTEKPEYKHLLVSPDRMEDKLIELILRKADHQKASGNGYIVIKINSLTDRTIINTLYEASNAGVHIDLIVRGICMLWPGIPNLSDNIYVISIVDRFLEHSRIFLLQE